MQLPKPSDAIHRAYLFRILTVIAEDSFLVEFLRFKGGTYAAMRGFLDRFSVDLDFDLTDPGKNKEIQKHLEKAFLSLGLEVKDKSTQVSQYFLKYPNKVGQRNTIQVDVTFMAPQSNEYEAVLFADIDRILYGHTLSTLFSNKLIALMDRFERHGIIAGRDLYDIHKFFFSGFSYRTQIIEERTGLSVKDFFIKLRTFVSHKMSQTLLDEDLNVLLPADVFRKVRKFIKPEALQFLDDEILKLN